MVQSFEVLGSRASRRPSPTKLNEKSVIGKQGAGENEHPPSFTHPVGSVLDEEAPRRGRRLNAQPEETEERLEQHHCRDGQCRVNDHRAKDVGHHVTEKDAVRRQTKRDACLDEFLAPQTHHLASDDASHGQPLHRTDGDKEQQHVPLAGDGEFGAARPEPLVDRVAEVFREHHEQKSRR